MVPCVIHSPLLRHSHPVFDFRECLLDGVEVWRVWRQEPKPRASSPDCLAHSAGFVAAKIVHDDDIARLEGCNQLLIDISAEAFAVDRAIKDAWRGDPAAAQGCEESHCPPVTVWGKAAQSLALRSPAAKRSHVGLDPGLIDKHQPGRVEPLL